MTAGTPRVPTPIAVALGVVGIAGAFAAGWFGRALVEQGQDEERLATAAPPRPSGAQASEALERRSPATSRARRATDRPPERARPNVPQPMDVEEIRESLLAAIARHHPDVSTPDPAEIDAVARRILEQLERLRREADEAVLDLPRDQAFEMAHRERLRVRLGVLAGAAVVVLCARGESASVLGLDTDARSVTDAFDPFAPWRSDEPKVRALRGGLIRANEVFVLERVEVEGVCPGDLRGDTSYVEAAWPGRVVSWFNLGPTRAVFRGVVVLAAGDENGLQLGVRKGAGRVRFVGRVVPADAAPEPQPFVWTDEGAMGFLGSGAPVRLQVVADHGGGNPRTVDIAGRDNGRFARRAERSLWDEDVDLVRAKASVFFVEGAGVVPPDWTYHVERIDWRVRLSNASSGRHSRFTILAGNGHVVDVNAEEHGEALSGTWTGDVAVTSPHEGSVSITCHYFGMGEAVVYGRLEPPVR